MNKSVLEKKVVTSLKADRMEVSKREQLFKPLGQEPVRTRNEVNAFLPFNKCVLQKCHQSTKFRKRLMEVSRHQKTPQASKSCWLGSIFLAADIA
jgi:hypothetical protein